jgi:hypothetical protein
VYGLLHHNKTNGLMSAMGQKRTLERFHAMSALPPKADIVEHRGNVRFVPIADSCTAAFGGGMGLFRRTQPAARR